MMSRNPWLFLLVGVGLCAPLNAEFRIKPTNVTDDDRERAMRERPLIFGAGIIWNGRSVVYEMPEDFNAVLIERVRQAGVTATRFGLEWAYIEEEPGEYDWDLIEQERGLNRTLSLDLEVIGLIATTPGWATPTGEPGTFAPTEEAAELFEDFCRALARRYRGRIRYYQYGNSMDIDPGWMPKADAAQYGRWLRRAYRALKEGDPDCIVATGGHIGRTPGFLQALYREGYGDSFDAVAVNPWPAYEAPQGDEAFDWERIERYRAVMVENGDENKPIWCTEYGWAFERVGPEQQGEFAARTLDYLVHYPFITVSVYITMADWHRGVAGLFGLMDKDLEPRPAFEVWERKVRPIRPEGRPAVAGPETRPGASDED